MPHTPFRTAFRRPWPGTRRGLCLWLVSLAIIVLGGINYAATPIPAVTRESLAFPLSISRWIGRTLGYDPTGQYVVVFWGVVMVVVGFICWFCSYCHFGRDKVGYTIMSAWCAAWGTCYISGIFFGAGLRALGLSVIWLLFSGLFVVIAGFPNSALKTPPERLVPDAPPKE